MRYIYFLSVQLMRTELRKQEKQAQCPAAGETAATFIRVVRYNDESSSNIDNDFEISQKHHHHP